MWWNGKALLPYCCPIDLSQLFFPPSSTWVINFTWHTSTCSVRERGQQVQMSLDSPLSTALQTPWFPQQSLVFAWKFAWMHSWSKEPFVCCTCYSLFDWIVSSALMLTYTSPEPAYSLPRWMIIELSKETIAWAFGAFGPLYASAGTWVIQAGWWTGDSTEGEVEICQSYKVCQRVFGNFTVYSLLLWIHPWYGMCMYSWLYQVGVSLCYPRTFRLTGPLSYCANASQKCVLTAPNAAISTLVAEQGPYLVPWLWGVVKRKHPGKRIVEINSLIL